jgi:hypothetical protein
MVLTLILEPRPSIVSCTLAQIIAGTIWGYLLDIQSVRHSIRARITWTILSILTFAILGGGYAYEKTYTRATVDSPDFVTTHWTTPGYIGPMFPYIFYGFYDAVWQAGIYWYVKHSHEALAFRLIANH